MSISHSCTGSLPVSLNNAYLFRSLIQRNASVRLALVSALSGVGADTIKDTRILNPMILGTPLPSYPEPMEILVSYQHGGSEKIRLDAMRPAVIDLCLPETHTTLSVENRWLRFSHASTWEEMESISETDALIGSASETVTELLSDPAVLLQCQNEKKGERTWQIRS